MQFNFDNLPVSEWFQQLEPPTNRDMVDEAIAIERAARIEDHPFFEYAKSSPKAMKLWTSQEAVVTNPFSQVLFAMMANINNVHIRSLLMPVVYGEHSRVRKGVAGNAHPWLIWRLCNSMDLKTSDIKPSNAVIEFINVLVDSIENPMYSLGVLGIGNELMLIAEYGAVGKCFESACPEAEYSAFLQSNIEEDIGHSQLMADAAVFMTQMGHKKDDFLAGAKDGVDARIRYYDSLLSQLVNNKQ